jgi:hypothetical protein
MKDTITLDTFRDEMIKEEHGFSWEGATALFDYLVELEEDTGEEMEFDPIAFRCEFSEYESLKELNENYPEYNYIQHSPKVSNRLRDYQDRTTVIEVPNTQRIIIQEF